MKRIIKITSFITLLFSFTFFIETADHIQEHKNLNLRVAVIGKSLSRVKNALEKIGNGTYGICTKNPSDELHIFYKVAYQTLLNYLTECNTKTEYSPEEMQQVVNAANQYDHYVSEFTPLSFEISSRNKFVNKYNHKKIVN